MKIFFELQLHRQRLLIVNLFENALRPDYTESRRQSFLEIRCFLRIGVKRMFFQMRLCLNKFFLECKIEKKRRKNKSSQYKRPQEAEAELHKWVRMSLHQFQWHNAFTTVLLLFHLPLEVFPLQGRLKRDLPPLPSHFHPPIHPRPPSPPPSNC